MLARFSSVGAPRGSGTAPVIGTTSSGLVPHVVRGTISDTSSVTSFAYRASGSEGRVRQCSTARRQSSPVGAIGRPSR